MPDKPVWVIDDYQGKAVSPKAATPSMRNERNPALAFSLSLIFWGGGQIYNRQRTLGLFFFLLMVIFYGGLALAVLFWDFIASSLKAIYLAPSDVFAAFGIFYLTGLIFWAFNALHAYYKAARARTGPFQGINNRLRPIHLTQLGPICSSRGHGGLPPYACHVRAAFFNRSSMPGLSGQNALADRLPLPSMWRNPQLADEARTDQMQHLRASDFRDSRYGLSSPPSSS